MPLLCLPIHCQPVSVQPHLSCQALCTADCVLPPCPSTDFCLFLTPGFCLNPDCTSAMPNIACQFIDHFCLSDPGFLAEPYLYLCQDFWFFFPPAACAWPVLPVFFELLINILTIVLLPSLLLGPQSLPASPALTESLHIPQLPLRLKCCSDIYPCFLSGSVQFFVFTLLYSQKSCQVKAIISYR